jgi:hypothetical protein
MNNTRHLFVPQDVQPVAQMVNDCCLVGVRERVFYLGASITTVAQSLLLIPFRIRHDLNGPDREEAKTEARRRPAKANHWYTPRCLWS